MANVLFTKFFELLANATLDWDDTADEVYCILERDTSTYTANKDHDTHTDQKNGGFVEISVASYVRQLVTGRAVNIDDANDRVELDFDDISFGSLESGQTVRALQFNYAVSGTSTLGDDNLIAYIDTATGLPATLGGGAFNITINAEGFIQMSQP